MNERYKIKSFNIYYFNKEYAFIHAQMKMHK